jgi:hypothetical protein
MDPSTPFAHASEAEMARILDFYAVRWEYEPHTFPLMWNLDGDVVESFSPDFYLPDHDLYLEMTTLRQKLVRKKNRKLRRLRDLYPDVNIKLFYARDFRALMLKYGKLALVGALSGSSGQVAAPYGAPSTRAIDGGRPGPEADAAPLALDAVEHDIALAASLPPTPALRRRGAAPTSAARPDGPAEARIGLTSDTPLTRR